MHLVINLEKKNLQHNVISKPEQFISTLSNVPIDNGLYNNI